MTTNPILTITISDSTPTRTITVTQATDGTISVNSTSGKVGDTITVTATPDSGYKLKNILVDGKAITGNTFVMKDADATVTAEFEKVTVPAEPSKDTTSPQTGDNSNMILWVALLFISGGAVITLTVFTKRKKHQAR